MRRLFYSLYDRRSAGFALFLGATYDVFLQARGNNLEAVLFFVGLSAVFLLDVAFFVVLRKGAFNARVLAVIAAAGITYEFILVTQRVSLEGQIIGIAMLVPMFAYLYGMFIWGEAKPSA